MYIQVSVHRERLNKSTYPTAFFRLRGFYSNTSRYWGESFLYYNYVTYNYMICNYNKQLQIQESVELFTFYF